MRIAHTNDLHYRPGKIADRIDNLFKDMAEAQPDVITIAGDFTGDARDSMRKVFELLRKHYDGPVVACKGNHDWWVHEQVKDQEQMTEEFELQMRQCIQAAEDHNIHLLEEHGIWSHPDHFGICIIGTGGWYYRNHYKSNDYAYLPRHYQGKRMNEWLTDYSFDIVNRQIAALTDDDWTRIAMTHMPVTHLRIGEYHHFGETELGDLLMAAGCKKFLHGHMHATETGPRYESGSNGFEPKFIIVNAI